MKKIVLGLAVSSLLMGCASTSDDTASSATTSAQTGSLIQDGQLTDFRANSGSSDIWVKHADKSAGLGDVGSSKDTAFDDEGSARIRFVSANDDFTATPGLTQQISGLAKNTDYTLSFYYYDNKGNNSPSEVEVGLKDSTGKIIASKTVHARDVAQNPSGSVKSGFKLTTLDFNSGSNTNAQVFLYMSITDPSQIDKNGDIGKQTEVRVDEFKITKK
ncbi:hypothetical protein [Vibrio algivorus]|uniref:Lipoprotein n=1 Tax=Vibrio algivorus TaxID=1667024 RepID=A0A557NXF6_9VIBR|nr:hypothetical protein [Vibrio algivorus]TVO33102.1 hypothetical protein FOF44_16005 [Vibrio algivorus]GLT15272.1 hypothetical protein GCM10007931_22470 [Vibrio algivorus]